MVLHHGSNALSSREFPCSLAICHHPCRHTRATLFVQRHRRPAVEQASATAARTCKAVWKCCSSDNACRTAQRQKSEGGSEGSCHGLHSMQSSNRKPTSRNSTISKSSSITATAAIQACGSPSKSQQQQVKGKCPHRQDPQRYRTSPTAS